MLASCYLLELVIGIEKDPLQAPQPVENRQSKVKIPWTLQGTGPQGVSVAFLPNQTGLLSISLVIGGSQLRNLTSGTDSLFLSDILQCTSIGLQEVSLL